MVIRELYGLDEDADVDGVDRILFVSEEEAVNEITGAIVRSARYDISNTPELETDLKAAVTKAYRDAIDGFAENVEESTLDQFLAESVVELRGRLREAQQTLYELHERFSRRSYDLHPGNEAGRMRVAEKLAERQLNRTEDAQIEYVPRSELDEVVPGESVILLGPGGPGRPGRWSN